MATALNNNEFDGMPILMVDDERAILDAGAAALGPLGCKVYTASGEDEALAVLHNFMDELGLLITNLKKPQGDGWSLTRLVLELCPETPILVTSGQEDKKLTDSRITFLQKPFGRSELATAVVDILRKRPVFVAQTPQ